MSESVFWKKFPFETEGMPKKAVAIIRRNKSVFMTVARKLMKISRETDRYSNADEVLRDLTVKEEKKGFLEKLFG